MAWSNIDLQSVLEVVVILLQVCGVVALCITRLVSEARWVERGRVIFIITMVGLGVAGALCGRHDSEFALFAGASLIPASASSRSRTARTFSHES